MVTGKQSDYCREIAAVWAGPRKSKLSHPCGIYPGFAVIFPKTLEQSWFGKDQRKSEKTTTLGSTQTQIKNSLPNSIELRSNNPCGNSSEYFTNCELDPVSCCHLGSSSSTEEMILHCGECIPGARETSFQARLMSFKEP